MSFKFQAGSLVVVGMVFGLVAFVQAEEKNATTKESVAEGKTEKTDSKVSRAALMDGHLAMRGKAEAARNEERILREQIRNAEKSGDKTKVQQLNDKFRALHAENVRKLEEDRKNLQQSWKDMKSGGMAARKMGVVMTTDDPEKSTETGAQRVGKEPRKISKTSGNLKENSGDRSLQKVPVSDAVVSESSGGKEDQGKAKTAEDAATKSGENK